MKHQKIRLCMEMMRGNLLKYVGAVVAVVVTAAINFVTPLVLAGAIDALTAAASGNWSAKLNLPFFLNDFFEARGGIRYMIHHLWLLALVLFALYLVSGFVQFLRARWTATASESFAERLRNRLYAHLQTLPFEYHVNAQTGDLIQRCISDVETIRRFLATQGVEIFRTAIMLGIGIPVLFSIHRTAALFAIVLFIPMFLFAMWFFRWVKRYFAISDAAEGQMSAVLQENLTGVRVVRAFGRQRYEEERFDSANDELQQKSMKLYSIMNAFWALSDCLGTAQIGIALIAATVISVSSAGQLTPGEVTVFASYVSMLIWPLRQLGRILSEFGKSMVSLDRLYEILNAKPETETDGAVDAPLNQDIVFDNVRFSYPSGAPVLKGVSFSVKAGQTVAILGATGTGKSTLMLLLQRLYDAQAGSILIGGVDIHSIRKQHLRTRIGLVLQEPFLYSRTVRENIRIANVQADDSAIYTAAETACADSFIREFERGYETPVGERGVTLSGGQKQRVAIARTLLKQNDILIFDDSLSAVDTETDRAIRDALKKRRIDGETSATTFIVSHRLTTLSEADCIIVLEDGRVAQQGTHSQLIQADGLYKRIYHIQSALEEELNDQERQESTT